MKGYIKALATAIALCVSYAGAFCAPAKGGDGGNLKRAETMLERVYKYYWIPDHNLMFDAYPNPNVGKPIDISGGYPYDKNITFVWGYSAVLSGITAILEGDKDHEVLKLLKEKYLPGLDIYFSISKAPPAYACFGNGHDDRLYDDNIWLGIDFADLYRITKDKEFLERAEMIWKFVESGTDDKLGGGVYWDEGKKDSKNTCSNAPAVVLAVKLYMATKDKSYLKKAQDIYEWTKSVLRDPSDNLYWDNIKLDGRIQEWKFSYNAGQMIQAAALLHKVTRKKEYLEDAQATAAAAYNMYFEQFEGKDGKTISMLKPSLLWFHAIMMRGFQELYPFDKKTVEEYMKAFEESMDYGWEYGLDENGLMTSNLKGKPREKGEELLVQGAAIEMFAKLHAFDKAKKKRSKKSSR